MNSLSRHWSSAACRRCGHCLHQSCSRCPASCLLPEHNFMHNLSSLHTMTGCMLTAAEGCAVHAGYTATDIAWLPSNLRARAHIHTNTLQTATTCLLLFLPQFVVFAQLYHGQSTSFPKKQLLANCLWKYWTNSDKEQPVFIAVKNMQQIKGLQAKVTALNVSLTNFLSLTYLLTHTHTHTLACTQVHQDWVLLDDNADFETNAISAVRVERNVLTSSAHSAVHASSGKTRGKRDALDYKITTKTWMHKNY